MSYKTLAQSMLDRLMAEALKQTIEAANKRQLALIICRTQRLEEQCSTKTI